MLVLTIIDIISVMWGLGVAWLGAMCVALCREYQVYNLTKKFGFTYRKKFGVSILLG